jgi:TonB-linked SusC/RagA family outer membrane protein
MTPFLTKPRFLLFLFFILSVSVVQAQTITGTVRSAQDDQLLPGVTVQVKGTSRGTTTDARGIYKLSGVNPEDSLVFSYIGFDSRTLPVGTSSQVDVQLTAAASSLNQVVVIGYGTAKKSDLTGAVAQLDASKYQTQPMTQLTDMLTGTVAGININQGTSASGGNSFMEIRGQTSLNASNAPMIVLDGSIFNGSLADINPSDVKTIDILKDASSAAIYGARASNGVIMITTKTGRKGPPTIRFRAEVGMNEAAHAYKPYDAQQYMQFKMDLLKGWGTGFPDYYFDNPDKLPQGITLDQWRHVSANPLPNDKEEWLNRLRFFPTEISNYLAGKSIDWYDQVMQRGIKQSYDISVSGGSDKASYYWSGGYTNNEGIITGDKFSAIRTRLNVDYKVARWMDVGMNTQFAHRDMSAVPVNLDDMYRASPYGSKYDSTGNLKFYTNGYPGSPNPFLNPYNQQISKKENDLFATLYANIDLPFGIKYKLSFQPHYIFGHDYDFWPSATTLTGSLTHTNGFGSRKGTREYDWILDNIIHWNKTVGAHNFDLTLLYSSEEHRYWLDSMTNENFAPNENLGYDALQFGINPTLYNNDTRATGDAMMARLNYSFMDRYLLTLSVRRDGYSAFGQKNPTATFPAAAVAWKISDEKFFHLDWVNSLKLRFSWGVNGNRDIGAYSALAQISSNLYYDGSNTIVGVYNNSLANPNLAWERTASFNYGLDATLLNDRLSVSANYYSMKTTDLLMKRILPAITGFKSITSNLGEVDNHGFELTVTSTNVEHANFSWRSNFVFSLNRNKIKHLFGDYETIEKDGKTITQEVPDYTNKWFPGQAIDRIWDYNITGIWQLDEKDQAAIYNMVPGDYKAEDVNHDSSYQALDDKQFIGYTTPQYRLGLRNEFTFFQNLSLVLFIRADLGQMTVFPNALHDETSEYDRRNITPAPDYWTPDHPSNEYPRLLVNNVAYGGGLKIYKPSSFVRIQDLIVSYNIPQYLVDKAHISNFRVYASVRNLYAFTNWPGWDPESGNKPMPRTYTLGLSFSL